MDAAISGETTKRNVVALGEIFGVLEEQRHILRNPTYAGLILDFLKLFEGASEETEDERLRGDNKDDA